jgi:acetate kinase
MTAADLGEALEHESGLLGLSSRSGDLREVLAGVSDGDEACRTAYEIYVHRLVGEIARMAAALGGVDAITFTGGVGENSSPLRAAVSRQLTWLGVVLDAESNESGNPVISAPGSPVGLAVLEAREDLTMSAQARDVLSRS